MLTVLTQGIAISEGVLKGERVQGIRYPEPNHLSGWYLTTDSYNGDINTMQVLKLHEFVPKAISLVKYLALPPGFAFEADKEGNGTVWFENDL